MLARELGMTVEELAERMTEVEYQQWIALYELEAAELKSATKQPG